MKKLLMAAAAFVALPVMAQAQSQAYPGFYIGAEGGLNWMFNSTTSGGFGGGANVSTDTGWAAGGMIGYDFVGPRVELEGVYRNNWGKLSSPALGIPWTAHIEQTAIMANLLYDFRFGSPIVPYIGAGAGISFVAFSAGSQSVSTQFAYQGIIGVGYEIDPMWRINIDGRYHGTTSPTVNNPVLGGPTYTNNNITLMASLQLKFGAPAAVPPPPPPAPMVAPPSFMVFFDWDRSNLSAQALNTIKQAAAAFKSKGNARITATGHTDTSGPEAYNMALSLRRANAVKDALVREGVPATAIAVVGRGEQGLLVQTGDGVREPQNRRVEIVIQ